METNKAGLTTAEKRVLEMLAEAWNRYTELPGYCREVHEFADSIHRAQQIIALRVARRVNPEIWDSQLNDKDPVPFCMDDDGPFKPISESVMGSPPGPVEHTPLKHPIGRESF